MSKVRQKEQPVHKFSNVKQSEIQWMQI